HALHPSHLDVDEAAAAPLREREATASGSSHRGDQQPHAGQHRVLDGHDARLSQEELRHDRREPERGNAQKRHGSEDSMQLRFHDSTFEERLGVWSIVSSVPVAAWTWADGISAANSTAWAAHKASACRYKARPWGVST